MNDDDQNDLREQVELLRGFADQGQSLPLVSGALFIIWGLVIALAGGLAWSALVRSGGGSVAFIWIGALVVGWLASLTATRILRLRSRDGGVSYGNQVTRVVWRTAGVVISAYALLAIYTGNTEANIPSVALLISGLAFVATAAAASSRVLYVAGAGWIGTGLLAMALRLGRADIQLALGVAGLLFLALPGLYLVLRARPRD